MAILEKVHSGLYCYRHYSIELDGARWYVWDHNSQHWVADFALLRDARAFLFEQE